MNYQDARDVFDELKNFERKATFKEDITVIELFVLLPREKARKLNLAEFIDTYQADQSFEIEGNHNEEYTIIGINTRKPMYSDDLDYFRKLLVW